MSVHNPPRNPSNSLESHFSSAYSESAQDRSVPTQSNTTTNKKSQIRSESINCVKNGVPVIGQPAMSDQHPLLINPATPDRAVVHKTSKNPPSLLSSVKLSDNFARLRDSRFKNDLPFSFVVSLAGKNNYELHSEVVNDDGDYRTEIPDTSIVVYCHKHSNELIPTITVGELRKNPFHCLNILFADLAQDYHRMEPFEVQEDYESRVVLHTMFSSGIYVKKENSVAEGFIRGMSDESFSNALGPALVYAVYSKEESLAQALIQAGAHFSSVDSEGNNAIRAAIALEEKNMLKIFLASAKTPSDIGYVKYTRESLKNSTTPEINQILSDFLSLHDPQDVSIRG